MDVTEQNPSWAGASGEIVTSTRDLDRFLSALLSGKLLSAPMLEQMRSTRPTGRPGGGYGLGLSLREFAPGCVGIGHTGKLQGYQAAMFSTPDGQRRFVLSANHGEFDFADQAAHKRIAEVENRVGAEALCGRR